jgi:protocatechuate 3,4-dioxygenase beta subunit
MHRRQLLRLGLGSALLVACGGRRGSATPTDARLEPTIAVDDGDADDLPFPGTCDPTAENIEGPFFKPGAPARTTLVRPDDDGQRLALGGLVLGADCTPLAGAALEIWHADARGGYDNDGYHFRGALRTGADGRWSLRTIVPGRYLNGRRYRPAHVHVKLRAPGHRPLTTQLYFDGDPYNDGDPFLDPSLVMPHRTEAGLTRARFDFVLAAG